MWNLTCPTSPSQPTSEIMFYNMIIFPFSKDSFLVFTLSTDVILLLNIEKSKSRLVLLVNFEKDGKIWIWKGARHKNLLEGLWPSFKLINFIRKHERKKLDNPLLSMKPYHFHQLLEDIQIYVCTNGPGLFEMKNFEIWRG